MVTDAQVAPRGIQGRSVAFVCVRAADVPRADTGGSASSDLPARLARVGARFAGAAFLVAAGARAAEGAALALREARGIGGRAGGGGAPDAQASPGPPPLPMMLVRPDAAEDVGAMLRAVMRIAAVARYYLGAELPERTFQARETLKQQQ